MARVAIFLLASSFQVVVGLCLKPVWLRQQIIEGEPPTFFPYDFRIVLDFRQTSEAVPSPSPCSQQSFKTKACSVQMPIELSLSNTERS